MVQDFSSSVLLTYKGKMLLLSPDLPINGIEQQLWCFIGGGKVDERSPEQAIYKKIKYTTKLDLKNIRLLQAKQDNPDKYFYHGELTDKDVNSMERREGQRLEFFTLGELSKLPLTQSTAGFLSEYKNVVEELFVHE